MPASPPKVVAVLAAASLAALVLAPVLAQDASATHAPANKVAAVGSTIQVFGPTQAVTLLSGTMKASKPTDLLLTVSLECSIITQVTTVGNDNEQAFGRVEVWVQMDGRPVGVTDSDDGRVVFCDRVHRQQTSLFDDGDATIATFLSTRTAHAFTWVALNAGSGAHVFEVKARLTEAATQGAVADAAVGKRTFVAEPTKLANDVTL